MPDLPQGEQRWSLRPPLAGEDPGGTNRPVVSVGPPVEGWVDLVPASVAAERDRLREALEDIADNRPDGLAADFVFYGRAEDREEAMRERARAALHPSSSTSPGLEGDGEK